MNFKSTRGHFGFTRLGKSFLLTFIKFKIWEMKNTVVNTDELLCFGFSNLELFKKVQQCVYTHTHIKKHIYIYKYVYKVTCLFQRMLTEGIKNIMH